MKIGVMLDSFRLPFAEAARAAASLGADGVQIYAVGEDFGPRMPQEKKNECKKILDDNGLAISALCGDLGGHGFEIAADNAARVAKTREIMAFAREMGTAVVTTHIGVLPEDEREERYDAMYRAMEELDGAGKEYGVRLAIETGPEPAARLFRFVSHFSPAVGINFDPANLVMVTGDDPVAGVRTAGERIVHTHAKDGVRLRAADPREVYNAFAEGGILCEKLGEYFLETPLGEGHVDFPGWIAALRSVGYDGFLTIEREVGAEPQKDIARAAAFLKTLI